MLPPSQVRDGVSSRSDSACEVCGGPCTPEVLRDGSRLDACRRCGHVLRDLAAAPASHRSLAYGGEPGLDRIRLRLTLRTLDRVAGRQLGTVFEVGYGAGHLLRVFLDRGVSVAGCDPDQLDVAVDEQVRGLGALQQAPIEEVRTEGVEADLVYGVHVIEHVDDPARMLQVCRRLLRPGGRIVLFTPGADSWSARAFSDAWWLLEDPTHVRFFSALSLLRALESAGFVDVRVRRLVTDNLTMEGASLVRALRRRDRPRGVLAHAGARRIATLLSPLAFAVRVVVPRWRPTLVVTATVPA